VLAVIALVAVEPEEALLEDRVALVPERQRQAEPAVAVAETGQAVFVPTVGPATGLLKGKVVPGGSIRAVVLANRTPGPLSQVRPPALPVLAALTRRPESLPLS